MLKDHKLHLTIVILDTQIDILNYLYLYLDLYWLSHTKAVENETVFHSPENAVQAAGEEWALTVLINYHIWTDNTYQPGIGASCYNSVAFMGATRCSLLGAYIQFRSVFMLGTINTDENP